MVDQVRDFTYAIMDVDLEDYHETNVRPLIEDVALMKEADTTLREGIEEAKASLEAISNGTGNVSLNSISCPGHLFLRRFTTEDIARKPLIVYAEPGATAFSVQLPGVHGVSSSENLSASGEGRIVTIVNLGASDITLTAPGHGGIVGTNTWDVGNQVIHSGFYAQFVPTLYGDGRNFWFILDSGRVDGKAKEAWELGQRIEALETHRTSEVDPKLQDHGHRITQLEAGGGTGTPTPGATTFTGLADVPSDYLGMANKILAVKDSEDGLMFLDHSMDIIGNDGVAAPLGDMIVVSKADASGLRETSVSETAMKGIIQNFQGLGTGDTLMSTRCLGSDTVSTSAAITKANVATTSNIIFTGDATVDCMLADIVPFDTKPLGTEHVREGRVTLISNNGTFPLKVRAPAEHKIVMNGVEADFYHLDRKKSMTLFPAVYDNGSKKWLVVGVSQTTPSREGEGVHRETGIANVTRTHMVDCSMVFTKSTKTTDLLAYLPYVVPKNAEVIDNRRVREGRMTFVQADGNSVKLLTEENDRIIRADGTEVDNLVIPTGYHVILYPFHNGTAGRWHIFRYGKVVEQEVVVPPHYPVISTHLLGGVGIKVGGAAANIHIGGKLWKKEVYSSWTDHIVEITYETDAAQPDPHHLPTFSWNRSEMPEELRIAWQASHCIGLDVKVCDQANEVCIPTVFGQGGAGQGIWGGSVINFAAGFRTRGTSGTSIGVRKFTIEVKLRKAN